MTVIGRVKVKIYKARHVSPFVSVTEKETEAGKSIKYKMFSRKFNLADKYKTNRQPRIRLAYSVIHTTLNTGYIQISAHLQRYFILICPLEAVLAARDGVARGIVPHGVAVRCPHLNTQCALGCKLFYMFYVNFHWTTVKAHNQSFIIIILFTLINCFL